MADIEKVMQALENCKEGGSCDGCQFDIQSSKCIFLLHADALELLKEQQKEIVPYIDIDEAKCPDCKVKLTRQELLGEDVLFEDFYDYCPHCGRKVKWE